MRLLLDTDALLRLLPGDPRPGAQARQQVDTAAELVVSAASLWEIAIKVSIGELAALPGLPAVLAEAGVRRLGIEDERLRRPESLPWHHRDPFDRLLIARGPRGGAHRAHGRPGLRRLRRPRSGRPPLPPPSSRRRGDPPHSGMQCAARRLALGVDNLWGLTRRRALDFGRTTTASC